MAIHIRREAPADYRTVEELVRESFWNVYHPGCTEHYVLHRYRNEPDFVPELDLVLEKDGEIIGQVIYVKSKIDLADGSTLPVMTFGPIGIAPQYKRQGYGKLLLDHSMEIAAKMDAGALCITGNILFYGKSGFAPASQFGVRYADADPADAVVPYFLAKELTPRLPQRCARYIPRSGRLFCRHAGAGCVCTIRKHVPTKGKNAPAGSAGIKKVRTTQKSTGNPEIADTCAFFVCMLWSGLCALHVHTGDTRIVPRSGAETNIWCIPQKQPEISVFPTFRGSGAPHKSRSRRRGRGNGSHRSHRRSRTVPCGSFRDSHRFRPAYCRT